jgi:hypothetical protein
MTRFTAFHPCPVLVVLEGIVTPSGALSTAAAQRNPAKPVQHVTPYAGDAAATNNLIARTAYITLFIERLLATKLRNLRSNGETAVSRLIFQETTMFRPF